MTLNSSTRRQQAFTLIELLVSLAIVAILIALIGVAGSRAMETTRIMRSATNLKELAATGLQYAADNEMTLPGSGPGLQWDMDILRHWNPAADPAAPAGSPGRIAAESLGKTFASPLDKSPEAPGDIRRSYVMNVYLVNLWNMFPAYPGAPSDTPVRLSSITAPSKVWFIGDGWIMVGGVGVPWNHLGECPSAAGTFLPGDWVQVAFLDGHVERIDIGKMGFWTFRARYADPQTAVNY